MTKIIIHPNKLNRLFKTKMVDYATTESLVGKMMAKFLNCVKLRHAL